MLISRISNLSRYGGGNGPPGDFSSHMRELSRGGFLFILVIGTTDTSLVPGITIAGGAKPELTHYTPAADAEYLVLGRCRVIPTVPMTPDGKPTPALITRAAIKLTGVGVLVVNAGARVRPNIPIIDLQGEPGRDIRTGLAIDRSVVDKVFNNGVILGENLARVSGGDCHWRVNTCGDHHGNGVPGGHGLRRVE